MIKIIDCRSNRDFSKLNRLLAKRKIGDRINKKIIKRIISEVKKNGDKAIIKYEKKYSNNNEK